MTASLNAINSTQSALQHNGVNVIKYGANGITEGVNESALVVTPNSAPIKTALNASGATPIYACRAWVNFNGTGTVAIRASGNVSSITDNGTGNYTVNFATAMPDSNFSAAGMVSSNVSGGESMRIESAPTASAFNIQCSRSGANFDPTYATLNIVR